MPDTIKGVGSCQKKCKVPSEVPFHTPLNPSAPKDRDASTSRGSLQVALPLDLSESTRIAKIGIGVVLILYISEIVHQPESTTSNLDQRENIYVY